VTDDPGVQAGGDPGPSGGSLPSLTELQLGTSPDLAEIARLVLAATVPAFADGTGVFVLEQLLGGAEPAGRTNGDVVVARRLGTRFASAGQQASESAFPPGDVIVFGAESPPARCVRSGEPVAFRRLPDQMLEAVRLSARVVLAGYNSFLAVPMTAHDAPIGFLVLARARGTQAFCDSDAEAVARLAAQAGTGIAKTLSLMREQAISDELPGSPLAAKPPVPSSLEIAGRCLSAAGHLAGGDWYDVVSLPDDRTGLVVGDVMSQGPEAGAVLAQVRSVAHSFADLDLPPAELLWRLNRWTGEMMDRITLATCAYAVIDPVTQSCTVAGAGHLPPVLALPDGTTRVADLPAGQSLGLGSATYGEAHIKLPPGAILALYTDGLVESRTRSFEEGILALQSVLAREHGPLEAVCDAVISSLAGRYEDDITVILARIWPDSQN
jgi:serine phosphatase RsbU (regulator of sigma subunit)